MGFERNASESMPEVNCSIIAIASAISPSQRREEPLKDKHRLAFRSLEHVGPQHGPVR